MCVQVEVKRATPREQFPGGGGGWRGRMGRGGMGGAHPRGGGGGGGFGRGLLGRGSGNSEDSSISTKMLIDREIGKGFCPFVYCVSDYELRIMPSMM